MLTAATNKKPRATKPKEVTEPVKPAPAPAAAPVPETKTKKKKEKEVAAPALAPAPVTTAAVEPAATKKSSKKRKQPDVEAEIAAPAAPAPVAAAPVAQPDSNSDAETADGSKKGTSSNRVSKFSDFLSSLGPIATALTNSPSVDVTKQIQQYLNGTIVQKQAARDVLLSNGISLPEVGSLEHKTIVSRSTFLFRTVFDKLYDFEKEEKKRLAASRKIKRRTAPKKSDDGTGQTYGIRNPTTRISQALATLLSLPTTLSCTELTQRISSYLNENNLRNPEDKREILPNAALKSLLPSYEGKLTCFNIHSLLYRHKSSKKTDGLVLSEIPADQAAAIEAKIAANAAKEEEKKRNKVAKTSSKSDVATESH